MLKRDAVLLLVCHAQPTTIALLLKDVTTVTSSIVQDEENGNDNSEQL